MFAAPSSPAHLLAAPLSDAERYAALAARDTSFDGVFIAGVKTTGIFCRPGCPARTPLRVNVEFFATCKAAMLAGYRACLRCKPLEAPGTIPRWAARLIDIIEAKPMERVTAEKLRSIGIDPARASRFFKRQFAMTFAGYCRAKRMGLALRVLRSGSSGSASVKTTDKRSAGSKTVTRAMLASGFQSESGFREAFERVFGEPVKARAGAAAPADGAPPVAVVQWFESPLGPMLAGATTDGVCLLEFVDRRALQTQIDVLRKRLGRPMLTAHAAGSAGHPAAAHLQRLSQELVEYFAGTRREFSVALVAPGTDFQAQVWQALRAIPPGATRSYAQIAKAIGRPTATRAVARANGDNRLAILIPCHRVIGSDGSMTGYGGGVWRKEALLKLERDKSTVEPGSLFASAPQR